MAVSEPEFRRALSDFVFKIDQLGKSERWTLHKSELGICAKQSVMVKFRGEAVNRQVHITYNSTYSVPVLWFNFYRRVHCVTDSAICAAMQGLYHSSNSFIFYEPIILPVC
ncbi:hypothetical protein Y032_0036g3188 [Ancylostoma ceylanicum]|uniref:Uncharacterized protein n=1 Tax=Ancylostoma ceylanicum TaxID=53326 RepID=A0A016ULY5_9BILA|nr:hypothetical protein Y032_0036g3188 [Ancylostoma ceylanicum]